MTTTTHLPAWIQDHAPWLLEPALGTCVVGTRALAEACHREGLKAPEPRDLDLAWSVDVEAGSEILARHDAALPITDHARNRGTLAFRVAGERIEITSYRGGPPDGPPESRLANDLAHRECTVAAIAWRLHDDRIVDPMQGLAHWREGRLEPCGDARARFDEHPIRLFRWYRRAHAWHLNLAKSIRSLPENLCAAHPPQAEALAAELRTALLDLESPGRMLLELAEDGQLTALLPELAPQFDGRAAGPQRYHPEVSQALHLVLALEWATGRTKHLSDDDRVRVLVAVLCHDLGKGLTPGPHLPSHHGHEEAGVPLVDAFLDRLPSLTDAAGRRLAQQVCRLHLGARRLRTMRPGTLAKLYDREFRGSAFQLEPFALALAADSGGRLGFEANGDETLEQVRRDVTALQQACESVDVQELRTRFDDVETFKAQLHEARAKAVRRAFGSAE